MDTPGPGAADLSGRDRAGRDDRLGGDVGQLGEAGLDPVRRRLLQDPLAVGVVDLRDRPGQ